MSAVFQFECVSGCSVAFLARHKHVSGDLATIANTLSVHVLVVGDGEIGTTLNEDLDPDAVIFDELQTDDDRWPIDVNDDDSEHGYNFLHVVGPDSFPATGFYRVVFTITDSDENVTKIIFEGPARS